jgi:hypothetical protein
MAIPADYDCVRELRYGGNCISEQACLLTGMNHSFGKCDQMKVNIEIMHTEVHLDNCCWVGFAEETSAKPTLNLLSIFVFRSWYYPITQENAVDLHSVGRVP